MSKASDLARLITSGSTAIHGEAGVTSSGSTGKTTNLQQGLCKTWITYGDTASAGNPAVFDSFNHGSITDNGTGDTSYAYTNNMATAKGYAISGVTAHASDVTTFVKSAQPKEDGSVATNTCRIVQVFAGASSANLGDEDYVANMMVGDLA